MNGYSAHWRATILAATAFHFLMGLGFSYVLPNLATEPPIKDVAELEWVDVDLISDDVIVTEEIIPSEPAQENLPLFDAKELVIPEFEMPKIELPPPPEVKPIERPKPQPPPQVEEPQKKVEEPPKEVESDTGRRMGKPPVTVNEVYPEIDGFEGYIVITVTIGKDGKVKKTELVQSSGQAPVDDASLKAAAQWTFKPALDQTGRPMVCDKIITFAFKKS